MTADRGLVFDLGNVLLNFDITIAARRLGGYTTLPVNRVVELLWTSELGVAFEEGRISPTEFHARACTALGIRVSFERFCPMWNEIFTENRPVAALVERLSGEFPLYLLSNTNPLHMDFIKSHYPVISRFTRLILSYEVGARKPSPRIYQEVALASGLPPERLFYADDRKDFTEAGRRLGFHAALYTDPAGLERDLAAWLATRS